MPLYNYQWDDGSVSVCLAPNKEEAAELMAEGGDVDEARLNVMHHFIANFMPLDEKGNMVDDLDEIVGWDVSFDEETEVVLTESLDDIDPYTAN